MGASISFGNYDLYGNGYVICFEHCGEPIKNKHGDQIEARFLGVEDAYAEFFRDLDDEEIENWNDENSLSLAKRDAEKALEFISDGVDAIDYFAMKSLLTAYLYDRISPIVNGAKKMIREN